MTLDDFFDKAPGVLSLDRAGNAAFEAGWNSALVDVIQSGLVGVPRETLEQVREALRMVVSRKGGSFGALSECQDPCADALADLDRLLK